MQDLRSLSCQELLGTCECQSRDEELVRLIARHGLMRVEQVRRALGSGRSVTYRRLARLVEAGLVERIVVPGAGTLLRATRTGIRWTGLPFSVAAVFPAQVTHTLSCGDVAIEEGERLGHENVLTERELIAIESVWREPFASVAIGVSWGKPRRHRGDLVVLQEAGPIVIEVELTLKTPARLEQIVRGWSIAVMAGEVGEVHYRCAPGRTWRAVRRAVEKTGAESNVEVEELSE